MYSKWLLPISLQLVHMSKDTRATHGMSSLMPLATISGPLLLLTLSRYRRCPLVLVYTQACRPPSSVKVVA